jgi:hypothetical protein
MNGSNQQARHIMRCQNVHGRSQYLHLCTLPCVTTLRIKGSYQYNQNYWSTLIGMSVQSHWQSGEKHKSVYFLETGFASLHLNPNVTGVEEPVVLVNSTRFKINTSLYVN